MREELKEKLWVDVMEDYVVTAELGHFAKDQVIHKAEMRAHLDKLVDWLTTYRAQVLEEVMQAVIKQQQEASLAMQQQDWIKCQQCPFEHGAIIYQEGHCPKHPTN
jgi:hypothetical protein